MPAANTVAQMAVVVTADTSAAEKGLTDLGTKVGSAGSMLTTAFTGAAVAGIAAVGAGLASAVTSAADFEKTMSGVKAVSGATGAEMDQLSGLALQLGKDTSFSASEAGKGIEELVKGGLTIPDIMNGAAKATLDLAAAGGVSLPDAATIAANAFAEFNLKGSDMAHVADLIAGAANASALDVSDFKFSLSSAGAVAATVGFSFDDLAQGIAVMGKAGITGSDAGTSLKTMMMNLVPATNAASDTMRQLGIITGDTGPVIAKLQQGLSQTALGQDQLAKLTKSGLINSEEDLFKALDKVNPALTQGASSATDYGVKVGLLGNQFFDANGKVKSMADVAEVLKGSLAGMSQEQELATLRTLFGSDAIRAAAVLAKEGAAGFNEMADAMGNVTAASVGAEKLNNLNGSIEQLKGSLETMAITVGIQLLPILKDFVDAITQAANDALPSMDAAAKSLAATLAAWAPTLKAVAAFLWDHRDAVVAVVAALGTFVILTTVVGWITTIIGVVTTVSAVIGTLSAVIGGSSGVIAALGALVAILGGPVTVAIAAIALIVGALALAWANDWGGIQEKTAAVVDFLSGVPAMVSGFFDEIGLAAEGLQLAVSDAWQAIKDDTTAAWNGITQFLTDWWREILVALTGPIGLVAVLIFDNWDAIKTGTETAYTAIATVLTTAWGTITTGISNAFTASGTGIVAVVTTGWDAVATATGNAYTAAGTGITALVTTGWGLVKTGIDTVFGAGTGDTITGIVQAGWTAVAGVTKSLISGDTGSALAYAKDGWGLVKTGIDTVFGDGTGDTISGVVAVGWAAVVTLTKSLLSGEAAESLKSVVSAGWDGIVTLLKNVVQSGSEFLNAAKAVGVGMITSVQAGISDTLGTFWDWLKTNFTDKIPDYVKELLGIHSPSSVMYDIGVQLVEGLRVGMASRLPSIDDLIERVIGKVGSMSGDVDDWLKAAISYTHAPENWLEPLKWIVAHESGGDPHAKNPDSTAAGLFQIIDSTWAASRDKSLPNDIFNPVINAIGGIRYIQDRYDDPFKAVDFWKANNHYAAGGWAGLHGPELAWLGEGGPEYVVSNPALRSGAGMGAQQTMTLNIAIGGRLSEQIVVEGYALAASRGRLPTISRGRLPTGMA